MVRLTFSGIGSEPPERKDGQSERSSGRDEEDGERWESIAAAYS